jgi:hypothetical protein
LVATASSSSTIHHQTHTPPLPLSSQTIDFSRSPSIHPHPPLYVCVCKLLKTVVSGRRRRRRQAPLEEGGAPPRLYVAGPITQRPLPCCVCVCVCQAGNNPQPASLICCCIASLFFFLLFCSLLFSQDINRQNEESDQEKRK